MLIHNVLITQVGTKTSKSTFSVFPELIYTCRFCFVLFFKSPNSRSCALNSPNTVFRTYLRKCMFYLIYSLESCHCKDELVLVFFTADYNCFVHLYLAHRHSSTLHTSYIEHDNILTHSSQQNGKSLTLQ